jgi:sugar phosphate isomerase/epimerase
MKGITALPVPLIRDLEAHMTTSPYTADQAGLCLSTLHSDPRQHVREDVERLIRIARKAGFRGLAFQPNWVASYGAAETRRLLQDEGMFAGALEGAMNWGEGREGGAADADQLLDAASAIGAGVLHAATMAPQLDSLSQAADGFATLCERARAHDIKVSLEFLPWYAVPDLATAWRIVREAGADNGGICLDFGHWHNQPGGPDFDLLRTIPGERISYVQPTDSPTAVFTSAADYFTRNITERPLPGEGKVDVPAIFAALADIGAEPYFAYQVCNVALASEGAETMAAKLHANAEKIFV